jgi:hypothetical protein
LLELVPRPNLSILAPGYLGTPPKARDELAENSMNVAIYESALLRKLYKVSRYDLHSYFARQVGAYRRFGVSGAVPLNHFGSLQQMPQRNDVVLVNHLE